MQDRALEDADHAVTTSVVPDTAASSKAPAAPQAPPADDREEAVRSIFRLSRRNGLPQVSKRSLFGYYYYLANHLFFPFLAQVDAEARPSEPRHDAVSVFGLFSPARRRLGRPPGWFCTARKGNTVLEAPLAQLRVQDDDRNHRRVGDFAFWFRKCR